jgi:hypothetical protein
MKKFLLLLGVGLVGTLSAQPCFTNWSYVTPVQVTNPNTTALTNHQVLLTINTQALIAANKLNVDGSDLRFGSDCCTEICHYIESGINTSTTSVWVNVPAVAANGGTSTIYMYYGNPSASMGSDPACTFDLWDDFNNGQLNAFTQNCGTGSTTFSSGAVTSSWTSERIALSNATFPMASIYTAEANVTAASGSWPGIYWYKTDVNNQNYALLMGSNQVRISVKGASSGICDGHNWASSLFGYSNPAGLWSFTWRGTGDLIANFPSTGAITSTDVLYAKDTDLRLGFGGISSGTGSMTMDWIRVRKYASITPTYTIGAESGTNFTSVNLTANVTNICPGESAILDAGPGLSSYTWSTGGTSQSITVNAGGWYSVIGNDNSGCTSEDSVEIVEYPAPVVNLGPNIIVCPEISVDLDAGAGFTSYSWNSGGTGQIESIIGSGTFIVTVTDNNGCTGADTIDVSNFAAPTASYTFTTNDLAATFNDASSGAVSWAWDFGDGNTSTVQNPSHTYAAGGTYTVCLTVSSADGCEATSCTDVFVSGVGVDELSASYFETFPNPATSELTVVSSWNEALSYELVSANGSLIRTGVLNPGENTLNVAGLESGVYMLRTHGIAIRFVKK